MVVVESCREGEDGSAAIDEFMVEVLSLSLCCFVWISLSVFGFCGGSSSLVKGVVRVAVCTCYSHKYI
jgi:hypothetical protein